MVVHTTMYLEYHTVVVLCYFFDSDGKQFLVLRTYLVYNTVVRLCQFFCCGGKVLLRPEKKVLVVCLAGCAVVSVFGSGGK